MFDPFATPPPIAKEPLSVTLPVRNQAAVLGTAIAAWGDYLDHLGQGYELIVVDDGSTDETATKLAELSAKRPKMRVLRHEAPRGLGAALRTALAEARHPLFFYTTLDSPYLPSDLRKLLERIDGVYIVSGFRGQRAVPNWVTWARRVYRGAMRVLFGLQVDPAPGWLGSRAVAWSWLIFLLFHVRIHDIDSSFKLIRRTALARIPIQSDGNFVHAEILAKANFLGCLMDELPIATRPGPFPALPLTPSAGPSKASDLRRVFSHSDFGPYVPEPAPAPAPQAGP